MRISGDNVWERLQAPGSATQLGLIRMLFAVYILFLYSSPMLLYLRDLEPKWWPGTWTLMPAALESFIAINVPMIYWTSVVATILMAIGLFTRTSTFVAALGWILLFGFYYRVTKSHVEWPYWNFVFLVFVFAPAGDRLSLDSLLRRSSGGPTITRPTTAYRWAVELMILRVAVTYVSAGLAKLLPIMSGIQWLSGDMLLIMLVILGFHVNVYVFPGVNAFVYSWLACMVFFIPLEWFPDFDAPSGPRVSGGATSRVRPA